MIEKILLFFILVTLSFFFACKDKSPIYQLEDEQFIKILADMHISESASQHLSLSVRDSMAKVYLKQILSIHEVEISVFESEYKRLKNEPSKLKKIYEGVIKRINELKTGKKKEEKGTMKGQKQKKR